MLGAQVAMALDDASPTHTGSQHAFVHCDGPVHAVEQGVDLRQIEARHREHAAARGEFVAQALQVLVFADERSRRIPVEGHQHLEQGVDVALSQFAAGDHPVEHPLRR